MMKKSMKYMSMAALALMGAVMSGCSSEDELAGNVQPAKQGNAVTVTTTVGLGGDEGGNRALAVDYSAKTLTKTFAVDEQIAVIYENTSGNLVKAVSTALTPGDISADGKSATFTVTLTDPKASGSLKYIYPAAMAGETNVDYTKLNSQDGTLETIASKYDLAVYDGSLTGDATLPASPTLTNGLAIIAYTIKDNAATPNDLTSTITGMTINDGTNNYAVTRSAVAGPIYVAIQPTSGADIDYTATDGSKNYTKSVTGKNYAAGEFYQLGLRMAEAAAGSNTLADATVGMIVGTDGNAYEAADKDNLPTGVTAAGMVAYKSGSNGLAIALIDEASTMVWSTANGASGAAAHTPSVTGQTWKLPSQDEWKQMFQANGGNEGKYTGLNTAITTAGGTALQGAGYFYWSSTGYDDDDNGARSVYLSGGDADWTIRDKGYSYRVRACLAF